MMRRLLMVVCIGAASLIASQLLATRDASADTTNDRQQWATEFLVALGAPVNDTTVALMVGWQAAENVPTRLHNPLATTLKTDAVVGVHNSHGVRAYRDQAAGIAATVTTVRAYPSTAKALIESNADAFFAAPGWKTYCNCNAKQYVANIRAAYEAANQSPVLSPTPAPARSYLAASSVGTDSGRVHGQDRSTFAAAYALVAGGALLFGAGRMLRRHYWHALAALSLSAATLLAALEAAGVTLGALLYRGADVAQGWLDGTARHGNVIASVCVAVLLTLAAIGRARTRELLITAALTIWQCWNLAHANRRYAYPVAGWLALVALGMSHTLIPWVLAGGAAVVFVVTRPKALA